MVFTISLNDIKESNKREGKPFEIQGVFYRGKWYQDTFYITKEDFVFLLNALMIMTHTHKICQ